MIIKSAHSYQVFFHWMETNRHWMELKEDIREKEKANNLSDKRIISFIIDNLMEASKWISCFIISFLDPWNRNWNIVKLKKNYRMVLCDNNKTILLDNFLSDNFRLQRYGYNICRSKIGIFICLTIFSNSGITYICKSYMFLYRYGSESFIKFNDIKCFI